MDNKNENNVEILTYVKVVNADEIKAYIGFSNARGLLQYLVKIQNFNLKISLVIPFFTMSVESRKCSKVYVNTYFTLYK